MEEEAVGEVVGRREVWGNSLGVEKRGRLREAGSFGGEWRGVEDEKILGGGRGKLKRIKAC